MLSDGEETRSLKEAGLLLGVIVTLTRHLDVSGQQFTQVSDWAQRLCQEQNVGKLTTNISNNWVTTLNIETLHIVGKIVKIIFPSNYISLVTYRHEKLFHLSLLLNQFTEF